MYQTTLNQFRIFCGQVWRLNYVLVTGTALHKVFLQSDIYITVKQTIGVHFIQIHMFKRHQFGLCTWACLDPLG